MSSRSRICHLAAWSFAAWLIAAAPTWAAPDFSQSRLTITPTSLTEGDLVTVTVHLQNTGPDPAPHAEMELSLPVAALFVDTKGLDGVAVDLAQRTVHWSGPLPPGASYQAEVRLIVPRDAGGETLAPSMRVRSLFTGTESWVHGQAEIGTRRASSGVAIGGLRVTIAGLMVLAVLLVGGTLMAVARLRPSRGSFWLPSAIAVVVATGFWTLFAAMARHDWRVLREYDETQCTVLDRRVRFETSNGTARAGDPRASRAPARSSQTTTAAPLVAVRYLAQGVEQISTGFDTGSRLQVGGAARAAAVIDGWPEGARVPCWYDPADPRDVVLLRGFGGAYLFALFPLPVFLLGVWGLRRGGRSTVGGR